MTDSVIYRGRAFKDVVVGERFSDAMTVTEAHLVMAAGLFKDFNALHTNAAWAAGNRFGGRVAHGFLVLGIMCGVYSGYFHATDISTVEESARFLAPVYPGDTITTEWVVAATEPKRSLDGGLVTLRGTARNQHGAAVVEMEARLLVANAPFGDFRRRAEAR